MVWGIVIVSHVSFLKYPWQPEPSITGDPKLASCTDLRCQPGEHLKCGFVCKPCLSRLCLESCPIDLSIGTTEGQGSPSEFHQTRPTRLLRTLLRNSQSLAYSFTEFKILGRHCCFGQLSCHMEPKCSGFTKAFPKNTKNNSFEIFPARILCCRGLAPNKTKNFTNLIFQ